MAKSSLETFIEGVRPAWGPLTSEVVASCRYHLQELVQASSTEEWLAELHRNPSEHKELYRDPAHGFLLLAHAESEGRYRPPHDHGRGWVIYAVQRGEIEVGTYIRVQDPGGRVRLVKRETSAMRPGEVRGFLPGDIHETRCTAGPVTLFRLTDRDLIKEEKEERKLTRYVRHDGVWTERTA